jgi:hypothetical protein
VFQHSEEVEPLSDLNALPRAYRIGLRLQDLGADDDLIGDCLGIDPAGVSTLIEIGRQKLAAGPPFGASDPEGEDVTRTGDIS